MTQATETKTRGRKATFQTAKDKVAVLKAVQAGDADTSRFLKEQLVEQGLLEKVQVKATEGRGRPRVVYQVAGKGRNLITLSARWK